MELPKWITDVTPIKQGVKRKVVTGTVKSKGCGCKDKVEKLEEEVKELDKKFKAEEKVKHKK